MVYDGCVFVAGIHPSRTWISGSFESVRWNVCVHRIDSVYALIWKSFGGMKSEPVLTPRARSPLPEKFSPEEDRTCAAASHRTVSTEHSQWAIPAQKAWIEPRSFALKAIASTTRLTWQVNVMLDVLFMICTWLCFGKMNMLLRDTHWPSEEIVKILNCATQCNYYYHWCNTAGSSHELSLQTHTLSSLRLQSSLLHHHFYCCFYL